MRTMSQAESRTGFVMSHRVYKRKNASYRTWVARIEGDDPDYILQRDFLPRSCQTSPGYDTFTYHLEEGIYEFAIVRFDALGNRGARERKWILVHEGEVRVYEEAEMDYQYVLYCAWLLSLS